MLATLSPLNSGSKLRQYLWNKDVASRHKRYSDPCGLLSIHTPSMCKNLWNSHIRTITLRSTHKRMSQRKKRWINSALRKTCLRQRIKHVNGEIEYSSSVIQCWHPLDFRHYPTGKTCDQTLQTAFHISQHNIANQQQKTEEDSGESAQSTWSTVRQLRKEAGCQPNRRASGNMSGCVGRKNGQRTNNRMHLRTAACAGVGKPSDVSAMADSQYKHLLSTFISLRKRKENRENN